MRDTLNTGTKWKPGTANARLPSIAAEPRGLQAVGYIALLVFTAFYYLRPEDFVPGLNLIPWAKITGGIALFALILEILGKGKVKFPMEIKFLLLLFVQMTLAIPFAVWRGGAFNVVFEKFSKAVIVAMLISMIVSKLTELRRLLWIQAAAVAVVTVASVLIGRHYFGRLYGASNGILENPNDLAINIAINSPLCLAFLLGARGLVKKGIWTIALLIMMYAVVATYSRSGLIALLVTGLVCLWEYGVKGRRVYLVAVAGLLALVSLAVALMTPNYPARVESIFAGNIQDSGDRGSLQARGTLLKESIMLALHNPILGIGPGNFQVIAENDWRVAHNTYTEIAAEAGLPALILFVLALAWAFRNIRRVRKAPGYSADKELQLFTSALWASLAAYIVSACFASTEYNLFPYFMIAYTSALYRIAYAPQAADSESDSTERRHGTKPKRELAWIR
jgi:putative inorganic carbon (HCO3(-)) transporter